MTRKRKKRKKRGYPVAILVGFDHQKSVLWEVFSASIRPLETISSRRKIDRLADNELYNFHEEIIDTLRPHIKDGLRSIVLVAPRNTSYSEDFQNHIAKHHRWLSQKKSSNQVTFGVFEGHASDTEQIAELVAQDEFKAVIEETTAKEADSLIEELDELLNKIDQGEVVLYSLREIEELTYGQWKFGRRQPEYVILTERFLKRHKRKQRVHRLLQILENKKVRTKIVDTESAAGERISQFGGIVCFTKEVGS